MNIPHPAWDRVIFSPLVGDLMVTLPPYLLIIPTFLDITSVKLSKTIDTSKYAMAKFCSSMKLFINKIRNYFKQIRICNNDNFLKSPPEPTQELKMMIFFDHMIQIFFSRKPDSRKNIHDSKCNKFP